MIIVLFDKHCPLCRVLASLLADELPAGWQMIAWQDFQCLDNPPPPNELIPGHPQELCLRTDGQQWLLGEAAWEFLIKRIPRLQAYQELAAKIGISPPVSARWLRRLAHGMRRLCRRCPASALG